MEDEDVSFVSREVGLVMNHDKRTIEQEEAAEHKVNSYLAEAVQKVHLGFNVIDVVDFVPDSRFIDLKFEFVMERQLSDAERDDFLRIQNIDLAQGGASATFAGKSLDDDLRLHVNCKTNIVETRWRPRGNLHELERKALVFTMAL